MRRRTQVSIMAVCLVLGTSACGSSDDAADVQGPTTSVAFEQPGPEQPDDPDVSAGCAANGATPKSTKRATFRSGATERLYDLTVPPVAGDGTRPMPLVVNLHGATGNAFGQDFGSAFPAMAERNGFVVLSPEAAEPGRLWQLPPAEGDIRFVEELIDHTASELCIDRRRVYLAGFSMGGMISMALACEEPERYAAIAVVAGLIDLPSCARTLPVPAIAFQGTADESVHEDGSYADELTLLFGTGGPPRQAIAASWALTNGCAIDAPSESTNAPVTEVVFACPSGGEVEFHRIEGGTHVWPGGKGGAYVTATTTPQDTALDATQTIWDFFDGFRR